MSRKIAVFGVTRQVAIEQLISMLNDMRYGDVKDIVRAKHGMRVELSNGDLYETAIANDSSRGRIFKAAYVDKNVGLDVLKTIVIPNLCPKEDNEESLFFY